MARLGLFDQMFGGDDAQNAAINQNADRIDSVQAHVGELRELVKRQAAEIVQLRAMFMGLVSVLHEKKAFVEAELERAVKDARDELMPAPPEAGPSSTDPYRGTPREVSVTDIEAAKALLASAQDCHFAKQFDEARAIYQQIVDEYGHTKQGATARQQLENLKRR